MLCSVCVLSVCTDGLCACVQVVKETTFHRGAKVCACVRACMRVWYIMCACMSTSATYVSHFLSYPCRLLTEMKQQSLPTSAN